MYKINRKNGKNSLRLQIVAPTKKMLRQTTQLPKRVPVTQLTKFHTHTIDSLQIHFLLFNHRTDNLSSCMRRRTCDCTTFINVLC